jgi:hypothetical protein
MKQYFLQVLLHFVIASVVLAVCTGAQTILDDPLFQPGIRPAEFERVVEKMGLENETTAELFELLYAEHIESLRIAAGRAKVDMDAAHAAARAWREENPDRAWRNEPDFGWRGAYDAWLAQRDELETEFQQDIDALVGSQRAATWRRLSQGIRRGRELPNVRMTGCFYAIDLEEILDQLEISTRQSDALEAGLNQWSDELDAAIQRYFHEWNTYLEWVRGEGFPRFDEMPDDLLAEYLERLRPSEVARGEISQLGRRWMQSIAATLREDQRKSFLEAVDREAFPEVFTPSPVELLETELPELSLNPALVRAIREIIDENYRGRQQQIRTRLMRAYEHASSMRARDDLVELMWEERAHGKADWWHAGAIDHPAIPIWIENRQLSLETCRAIRALIPQEEFEKLPFSARLWLSWWEE